jgi:hypothetical protein
MARRFRYPNPDEFQPTDAELADARTAESAQGTDSTIGGVAGGVLGGALGALGIPLGLGEVTIPAGMSLGSGIGSAIGGSIGGAASDEADARLRDAQLARQKKLTALQMREQALNDLLAQG